MVGSVFCLVAGVGMLRLPDTLIRLHAATKAGTLGAGCILLAEAVLVGELSTTLKAFAVIVFLLLTAPVGAHLIGRAAYHGGIELFNRTWVDEWAASGGPPGEEKDGPEGGPAGQDGWVLKKKSSEPPKG